MLFHTGHRRTDSEGFRRISSSRSLATSLSARTKDEAYYTDSNYGGGEPYDHGRPRGSSRVRASSAPASHSRHGDQQRRRAGTNYNATAMDSRIRSFWVDSATAAASASRGGSGGNGGGGRSHGSDAGLNVLANDVDKLCGPQEKTSKKLFCELLQRWDAKLAEEAGCGPDDSLTGHARTGYPNCGYLHCDEPPVWTDKLKSFHLFAQVNVHRRSLRGVKAPDDDLAQEMTHDLEMNFNKIAPFGKEDTARELQDHAAKTQDTLVDAVENAEVAEIKRAVFRALTRLRAATIKEFDTIARLETQAIDAYNDAHHYRAENPLAHLHEDEAPVETDKLKSFH